MALFHGHICPGLIIGYQAAVLAKELLELKRDVDEELVAVVENDACGVDAIQWLLGCTLGKGNLIFRDFGKQAFSFFRRDNGKSVRLVLNPAFGNSSPAGAALREKVMSGTASDSEQQSFEQQKQLRIEQMLAAKPTELFDVKLPDFALPERARIFVSHACEECGELTMEPRIRLVQGRKLCLACSQPYQRGW